MAEAKRDGDDDEEVMVDLRRGEGAEKWGAGRCLIKEERRDLRVRREATMVMVVVSQRESWMDRDSHDHGCFNLKPVSTLVFF